MMVSLDVWYSNEKRREGGREREKERERETGNILTTSDFNL